MGVLEIIAIVAGVCSIVGFVLQLMLSKIPKIQKWIWVAIVVIMTLSTGYTVYSESELERVRDIHRQADAVYEHYTSSCDHSAYMQEMLTFLEEVQERYPDAYARAKEIYVDAQNMDSFDKINATIEMRGIVKGIATLNE